MSKEKLPKKALVTSLMKRYCPGSPLTGKGITVPYLLSQLEVLGITDLTETPSQKIFFFPFEIPELNAEVLKHIRDIRILRSVLMANKELAQIPFDFPMVWIHHIQRWLGQEVSLPKERDLRFTYWGLLKIYRFNFNIGSQECRLVGQSLINEETRGFTHIFHVARWISTYGSYEYYLSFLKKHRGSLTLNFLEGILGRSPKFLIKAIKILDLGNKPYVHSLEFIYRALVTEHYDEFNSLILVYSNHIESLFWRLIAYYKHTPKTLDYLFEKIHKWHNLSPPEDNYCSLGSSLVNLSTPEELYEIYVYYVKKLNVTSVHISTKLVSIPLLEFLDQEKAEEVLENLLDSIYMFVDNNMPEVYDYLFPRVEKITISIVKALSRNKLKEWRDRVLDLVPRITPLQVRNIILKIFLEKGYFDSIEDLRTRYPDYARSKSPTSTESLITFIKKYEGIYGEEKLREIFPDLKI